MAAKKETVKLDKKSGVFKRFTMNHFNNLTTGPLYGSQRVMRESLIDRTSRLPVFNKDSIDQEPRGPVKLSEHMISSIARRSLYKYKPNEKLSASGAQNIFLQHSMQERVGILKYREDVFRAASKLTNDMPPFPDWSYVDEQPEKMHTRIINVGGEVFHVYERTLKNLKETNLARCLEHHKTPGRLFIDRDSDCFHAIHNFYCTGRLHRPPNVCISFFMDELEFWGISADFLEPCCWTEYNTYKVASERLQRYQDDIDKSRRKKDDAYSGKTHLAQKLSKLRDFTYSMLMVGDNTVLSKWAEILTACFILLSIGSLLMSTTEIGRVERLTGRATSSKEFKNLVTYFKNTRSNDLIITFEYFVGGYFMSEIIIRFIVTPHKLAFFRDALNWVDILATLSSMLGNVFKLHESDVFIEEYLLVLKLPRIFRLFKITESLKSGMEAFVLTLKASYKELSVIFMFLFMVTVFFGSIVFVLESVFYDPNHKPQITSVFQGIWWAFITMTSVGYGDFLAQSNLGICCGVVAIMTGMIICQMPVPIFLKNFSVYYNQASARLVSQAQLMLCKNITKKEVREHYSLSNTLSEKKRKAGVAKFNQIFGNLK